MTIERSSKWSCRCHPSPIRCGTWYGLSLGIPNDLELAGIPPFHGKNKKPCPSMSQWFQAVLLLLLIYTAACQKMTGLHWKVAIVAVCSFVSCWIVLYRRIRRVQHLWQIESNWQSDLLTWYPAHCMSAGECRDYDATWQIVSDCELSLSATTALEPIAQHNTSFKHFHASTRWSLSGGRAPKRMDQIVEKRHLQMTCTVITHKHLKTDQ